MVEYRNIMAVNCKKEGDKWDCDIVRYLSDKPKMVNEQLCFITKTETEKDLSDIHLKTKIEVCTIDDIGTEKYLRCE